MAESFSSSIKTLPIKTLPNEQNTFHFFWSPVGCGSKIRLHCLQWVYKTGWAGVCGFLVQTQMCVFPHLGCWILPADGWISRDTPFRGHAPPVEIHKSLLVGFLKFGFVHKLGFV